MSRRDEDLSSWPHVTVNDFKALLGLLAAGFIFVAICAVAR